MGSLEQIDPGVIVAPKAVLLQNTLLVHLLSSLHPCLWALGKGERMCCYCHSWEWERKWMWDSDHITVGLSGPPGMEAFLALES